MWCDINIGRAPLLLPRFDSIQIAHTLVFRRTPCETTLGMRFAQFEYSTRHSMLPFWPPLADCTQRAEFIHTLNLQSRITIIYVPVACVQCESSQPAAAFKGTKGRTGGVDFLRRSSLQPCVRCMHYVRDLLLQRPLLQRSKYSRFCE